MPKELDPSEPPVPKRLKPRSTAFDVDTEPIAIGFLSQVGEPMETPEPAHATPKPPPVRDVAAEVDEKKREVARAVVQQAKAQVATPIRSEELPAAPRQKTAPARPARAEAAAVPEPVAAPATAPQPPPPPAVEKPPAPRSRSRSKARNLAERSPPPVAPPRSAKAVLAEAFRQEFEAQKPAAADSQPAKRANHQRKDTKVKADPATAVVLGRWPMARILATRTVADRKAYEAARRKDRDEARDVCDIARAWNLKDASARGAKLHEIDADIDGAVWTLTVDVDRRVLLDAIRRG